MVRCRAASGSGKHVLIPGSCGRLPGVIPYSSCCDPFHSGTLRVLNKLMDVISEASAVQQVAAAFQSTYYRNSRVLLIVPDNTRTAPVGLIFRALFDAIGGVARCFDVLIALGTHQPLAESAIRQRLEIN